LALQDALDNAESLSAEEVIDSVLQQAKESLACFTCSFQAEDIVLLDLLRSRLPHIPVLFLETGYHFPETYEFRDELKRDWGLNVINVMPKKSVQQQESEMGILYREDPSRCCQLRKVDPLMESLRGFEIWFTGLRREQSPTRQNLKKIEEHRLPDGKTLSKVSPLADWTWAQVWGYTAQRRLKYLPQYDQGYLSIGCQPCTAIPVDPTNPRSGRWSGRKLECGIHTFSERAQ
jgi:phosphoadenosine phosphosulfate reductase